MNRQSVIKALTTTALAPLGLAFCVLSSPAAATGDPEFIDFIVKKAHEGGLTACDAAVRHAFSLATGSDVRVTTEPMPDVDRANSLIIHTVYGYAGDVVQQEAVFRNLGGRCSYSLTTTMAQPQSCVATLAGLPAFKYEYETNGVI